LESRGRPFGRPLTFLATATPPTISGRRPPQIAQERLGHSSVGITLDTYSHVLPGMQDDAVTKVDAAIQAALNKPKTK
jgi:integrase